jgi:hypothetical protein
LRHQCVAANRDGIARVNGQETSHQLAIPALADAKDPLNVPEVDIVIVERPQLGNDGCHAGQPNGSSRHTFIFNGAAIMRRNGPTAIPPCRGNWTSCRAQLGAPDT